MDAYKEASVNNPIETVAAYVERVVAAAPPLSPDKRDKLAMLLRFEDPVMDVHALSAVYQGSVT